MPFLFILLILSIRAYTFLTNLIGRLTKEQEAFPTIIFFAATILNGLGLC